MEICHDLSLPRPSHHHHRLCVVEDRKADAMVHEAFHQSGRQSGYKKSSPAKFGRNGVHAAEKSRILLLVLWKVGVVSHLDAEGARKYKLG